MRDANPWARALLLIVLAAPAALPLQAGDARRGGRKIVLIAGKKSHGPGHHEYDKGARLLQACLEGSSNTRGYRTEVHTDGWPADPRALEDAATLFFYCDGSDHSEAAHPMLQPDRLSQLDRLMKKGVGLVALHYTVFVPREKAGDRFLEWLGGYFDYETGPPPQRWYSKIGTHTTRVQPGAPTHPVCRGISPFELREEYYYRMRFREGDSRRTPILTTPIPGEPEAQEVAWAVKRRDGGRGFAFTGGHFHDNWRVEGFRKLVLNALVWTAGGEVPEGGVASTIREELK